MVNVGLGQRTGERARWTSAQAAHARSRAVAITVLGLGLLAGILTGLGTLAGHPEAGFGLLALALPVLAWRYPQAAVWIAVGTATLVEQFPLNFPDSTTDHIPLFRSLSSLGLSGLQVTPLEVMVVTVLVVWIARSAVERQLRLPRSPMAAALVVFLGLTALYEGYGLARHGDLQVTVWELRGWFYLGAMFFMASTFFSKRSHVDALLWVMVVGSGLKGVQGALRYLVFIRGIDPPPNAILEHEEAFAFAVFISITICLWLFNVRGRLRIVATALLPAVVLADLANNRRTAWIIFGVSVVVLLLITYLRLPRRRPLALAVGASLALAAAVYFPIYWNGNGLIAQPARAVASAFTPSARDQSSDLYRVGENYNLTVLIKTSPIIGSGFGLVLPKALPVVDLTQYDPFIAYIPHNQILYLWVREGILGMAAFWFLIGMALVAACQLTRRRDRRSLVVGSITVCAVLGYVIEAWFDQGLIAVRITILLGALLGSVQFLAQSPEEVDEPIEQPRRQALRAMDSARRAGLGWRRGHHQTKPSGLSVAERRQLGAHSRSTGENI